MKVLASPQLATGFVRRFRTGVTPRLELSEPRSFTGSRSHAAPKEGFGNHRLTTIENASLSAMAIGLPLLIRIDSLSAAMTRLVSVWTAATPPWMSPPMRWGTPIHLCGPRLHWLHSRGTSRWSRVHRAPKVVTRSVLANRYCGRYWHRWSVPRLELGQSLRR